MKRYVSLTMLGMAVAVSGVLYASAKPKPAPAPINLIDTRAKAGRYAALIQAARMNCPAAKLGIPRGNDQFGAVVKVYCGPDDGTTSVYDAPFRVTWSDDRGPMVDVWR